VDTIRIALVYFVAGSVFLCITLTLFKIEYKLWQPVVASLAAGLCAYIPNNGSGPISLIVLLAVLRFATGDTWQNLFYPVAIARLALVPALLFVGRW
jgi:hypothetical protein